MSSDEKTKEVDAFSDWLAREMPGGTVIGDPRWWASRIFNRLCPEVTDEMVQRAAIAISGSPISSSSIDKARAALTAALEGSQK
jgi:hypothetical protein